MANVLVVDDAWAAQFVSMLAVGGKTKLPVQAVDSTVLVGSWSAVLAIGNVSGGIGNDPTISDGDNLIFLGNPARIRAPGSLRFEDLSGTSRFSISSFSVVVSVTGLAFGKQVLAPTFNQQTQDVGNGVDLTMQAQSASAGAGGDLIVKGGDGSTVGGDLVLVAGSGDSSDEGVLRMQYTDGGPDALAVVTDASPDGGVYIADPAGALRFQAVETGIAFNGGAPADAPSVTGSRASGAALLSLLTVLESMGLITDNTTV